MSSHGRLAHVHRLEAALERGVLLDVLAVLVERGRADRAQLAPGEHRLEHVAGVHRALGGAGADDRVELVDEDDDLALGVGDLLEHGLQPVLELAAVLRSGDHRAQVERDQPAVLEALGHVAGDDPLRQALDDRGLAHAGLADQHGVVLRAPGEDLDDAADLIVAADHRVELALGGGLGQVAAVALERPVLLLGVLVGHAVAAAHLGQRLEQLVVRRRRCRAARLRPCRGAPRSPAAGARSRRTRRSARASRSRRRGGSGRARSNRRRARASRRRSSWAARRAPACSTGERSSEPRRACEARARRSRRPARAGPRAGARAWSAGCGARRRAAGRPAAPPGT